MTHLIQNLHLNLQTPWMKVVAGVMDVNRQGNKGNPKQRDVRNGSRSTHNLPDLKGNTPSIETARFLHPISIGIQTGWLAS